MRPGLAALIALALLALPAPVFADSIIFIRDGDVWISTPDGTTERRLTAGGGHSSPSMADDGTRGGRSRGAGACRCASAWRCGRQAERTRPLAAG